MVAGTGIPAPALGVGRQALMDVLGSDAAPLGEVHWYPTQEFQDGFRQALTDLWEEVSSRRRGLAGARV
jgi:hypothetical protein